jgi:hypothetical protein
MSRWLPSRISTSAVKGFQPAFGRRFAPLTALEDMPPAHHRLMAHPVGLEFAVI